MQFSRTKCCWPKWHRSSTTGKWGKRDASNSSLSNSSIFIINHWNTKMLKWSPLPQFPSGLYGVRICHILAFPLQHTLMNSHSEVGLLSSSAISNSISLGRNGLNVLPNFGGTAFQFHYYISNFIFTIIFKFLICKGFAQVNKWIINHKYLIMIFKWLKYFDAIFKLFECFGNFISDTGN